ncbi:MAG TPA: elongation factor G [Vicinamibacterales bacterium]|nr:elongation factor G [Vicinamibacterales bacterium]
MKVYDASSIRNIAIVGHTGSGKTQLTSAILFDTGMVNRLGKVDEGNTVTDFDEEEIARQHTLSSAVAFAEWNKTKINLVDTPGSANFFSDARAALRVADAVLVAVDAVSGPEVQTEKMWEEAEAQELPRLVVLTRCDRERASLERCLDALHADLGRAIVPIQLPIGDEKAFTGVVDLVGLKAYTYPQDGSGRVTEGAVPPAMAEKVAAAREALVEMVAEADDSLMERFFEAGTLTQDELVQGLRTAVAGRRIFPLVCTSATLNIAVHPLLDAAIAYLPAASERTVKALDKTGAETSFRVSEDGPTALFVWKTIADPFAGRISLFRVMRGSVKADSTIPNATRDSSERLGHLLLLQGKTQTDVAEIKAGDLGAVAKLKDTQTGHTLGDRDGVRFPPLTFAEPVLSYAMEPKARGDEEKISTALQRIIEEDPTIRYSRDPQTHELLLAGQGQMHIEVTVARMKRRFGVEVNLKLPRIPYLETITASTEANGRHKKQTGGHGQFGDCTIRMEPLPRGGDFEFVDEIFGGAIPQQFRPAVEKGIQEARAKGYLAGYPVVDFRVTLLDGKFHSVDSNELSFKMAGRIAFKDAMTRCRPTILEPIMNVEVFVPSDYAGDIMGDVNSRRGRVAGMEQHGSLTVVKAQVPMSEMLTYEQSLTASTGARGAYKMAFSHYEEVPSHLQAKIIAASKAARGEEEEDEG